MKVVIADLPIGQWVVLLSGGEVLSERQLMDKSISPWQQVQQLLRDTGQAVKALALFTDDGRVFYAPRADGYWHVRAARFSARGRVAPQYAMAIGYRRGKVRHELWVTAEGQAVMENPWRPEDGPVVAGYWTEERCQSLMQQ
jgi:hypothetical protein